MTDFAKELVGHTILGYIKTEEQPICLVVTTKPDPQTSFANAALLRLSPRMARLVRCIARDPGEIETKWQVLEEAEQICEELEKAGAL